MSGHAAIADRYSRAIYELGVEGGTLAALTSEVQSFAAAYQTSQDLRSVLENPLVAHEQREAVLKDIAKRLGLGELALTAVRYLASRRRLVLLPDIARRLGTLADEKEGVVRATVTSAQPLSEAFYLKLTAELSRRVGKKVLLDRQQDPSLIAGVLTRVGDMTIDGSLRGRLERIERQLLSA
ncbi:MAG TPA: ATP synthase F1 subunit delta [Polyangiaceae bacterium]